MKNRISIERISRKEEYALLTASNGKSNDQQLFRLKEAVAKVIQNELTKRQCEILDLYFFQNKSVEEIAALLNVNKSTISRTKNRAIDKIKRFLQYYTFR